MSSDAKQQETNFAINFLMGGVSAAIAKTAASPIEREYKVTIDFTLHIES